MKLSIIIPVYNEKNTILEIIKKVENANLPQELKKEIIIVDDRSTDGTRKILKEIEWKYKIIFHEKNKGKGAAIKSALKEVTGDIVIIQDADLEYNPQDYIKLLDPILNREANVVYGSRFLNKHNPRYIHLYLGNKFLSLIFSLMFMQKISDMETCYKVLSREIINKIKIKSNRFNFEPEITAKIIKLGYKIKEVHISYQSRSFKEGKKINWQDGISAIYALIKYKFFN